MRLDERIPNLVLKIKFDHFKAPILAFESTKNAKFWIFKHQNYFAFINLNSKIAPLDNKSITGFRITIGWHWEKLS